jgi:hypothetical protein
MCAKQLLDFCAKKYVLCMTVTAFIVVRLSQKSCLSTVAIFHKLMAVEFLDFYAKHAQKNLQLTSSISVSTFCCTTCPKFVWYGPILVVPSSLNYVSIFSLLLLVVTLLLLVVTLLQLVVSLLLLVVTLAAIRYCSAQLDSSLLALSKSHQEDYQVNGAPFP